MSVPSMILVVVAALLLAEVQVRLNGTVIPGMLTEKSVSVRLSIPWCSSGVIPVSRNCEKSVESAVPPFETTPPCSSSPSVLDNINESTIGEGMEADPAPLAGYRSCSQANPVQPFMDCIVDVTVTIPPAFSCC